MRRTQIFCECGDADCAAPDSINDHSEPIVVYIAVGTTHPCTVDESKLPPFVRRMLKMDTARIEMHAACAPKVLARLLAETAPETTAVPG